MNKKTINFILISGIIICAILLLEYPLNYISELQNSAGSYNRFTQKIKIKAKYKSIPYIEEIFYHELGHHVWFQMNKSERNQYALSINKTNKEEIEESFAQDYSSKSLNSSKVSLQSKSSS